MPNVLMELYATLGLDTTDFKEEAEAAIKQGDQIADAAEAAFQQADAEYQAAKRDLEELEKKSGTTGAIIDGFMSVTKEVVQEAIEGIIEFGKQSIEAAAGTGSELAASFNSAKSHFDENLEGLKLAIGEGLLPIATDLMEIFNVIFDIGDDRRLFNSLDKIEAYQFENLEAMRGSLEGMFGLFGEVEEVEAPDVENLMGGLESQAAYWMEYANTLDALKQRGIDPTFLSEIANGTVESLATLQALEEADEGQIESLLEGYEAVQASREGVAQGLSDMQLSIDEDFAAMKGDVEALVAGMNQADAAKVNAALTGQGVVDGLASMYPSISGWVDTINAKLSTIGAGYQAPTFGINEAINQGFATNEMGFSYWKPHASGISYVPYNGYPALLHEGERVLTRQESADQRSGRSSAADSEVITAAVISGLSGMGIDMDGERVGTLVANRVSRQIARDSRTARRYG